MISVVSLRYYPAIGGVETTVLEISSRLAKSFQMKVVTSDLKVEKPFQRLSLEEQVPQYRNVPITRLESKKFLPLEGYGVVMKGLAKALQGSEMIHTHSYGSHHTDKAVKMGIRQGIPTVLTTYLHPASHSHHKMLRTFYDSTLGKKTLKRCTSIITLTCNERDYIVHRFGVSKEKITVIPSGIDLQTFRDLGRKREEHTLLFVGRLSPVKRLDMLLGVVARVRKSIPNVKLRIIGRDWGVKAQLIELIDQLKIKDNVELCGEMSFHELIEHYNRAKVFVNTSDSEGFPNTFIQACKSATPILSLNVNPDGFLDKFSCGLNCNGQSDRLSQGLKFMLEKDRYIELGRNARKYAQNNHNIEKVIEQYKKVFTKLIHKNII